MALDVKCHGGSTCSDAGFEHAHPGLQLKVTNRCSNFHTFGRFGLSKIARCADLFSGDRGPLLAQAGSVSRG